MAHALKSNSGVVVCLHEYTHGDGAQNETTGNNNDLNNEKGQTFTRKIITQKELAQKQSKLESSNKKGTRRTEYNHEPPRLRDNGMLQLQMQ